MKYLKVKLWGKEIGRLAWEASTRRTYFMYNSKAGNDIPDIAPLLYPVGTRNPMLPIYGDDRPMYQGLPPFIADSLPDSWGNTLFDRWVKENRIPRNKVTPLYKLMFIGTRGMGALEFEPCAEDLAHTRPVDIKSLYEMSLRILEERDDTVINGNDKLTLQALLAVGTSAGGRQMKAIIALNEETGVIRSGQTTASEDFDYYILKFGDSSMPASQIEMAYHDMAVAAGINMEECRLLDIDGTTHFLTKRFDRKNGRKILTQTLAAIYPEARSYEDLVAVCRALSLGEGETEEMFIRMVFNVIANNTDDHNKNFSFLLEENGKWCLAPAYDVTFIFNTNGTGPNRNRRLSLGGKTTDIVKSDLLDFARQLNIKNASTIIDRVANSIEYFSEYADKYNITQPWRGIIQKTLNDNLAAYGYKEDGNDYHQPMSDKYGRTITDFFISVNSKGHYDVMALIDGNRRRRFIRSDMELFSKLYTQDIFNLPINTRLRLIESLFPPEKRN